MLAFMYNLNYKKKHTISKKNIHFFFALTNNPDDFRELYVLFFTKKYKLLTPAPRI